MYILLRGPVTSCILLTFCIATHIYVVLYVIGFLPFGRSGVIVNVYSSAQFLVIHAESATRRWDLVHRVMSN